MTSPCFHWNRNFCRLLLAIAIGSTAAAEVKLDYQRITPVAATEQIPVADFFRPRLLQDPKLNPSGTHLAAVITVKDERHQLLVFDLKANKSETVGGRGDMDVSGVDWLTDSRLVFQLSTRKKWGLGLIAANVGALKGAYPVMQNSGSSIIAVPRKNPLQPLVRNRIIPDTGKDGGAILVSTERRQLASIEDWSDLNTNEESIAAVLENNEAHLRKSFPELKTSGTLGGFAADREGELAYAFSAEDGVEKLHGFANGAWFASPADMDKIDVVGVGNQPGTVIVAGPRQKGKPRALQVMNVRSGELGEVILQDQSYDFSGWLYRHPVTREVLGAVVNRDGPRVAWFTEAYRKLQSKLDGFFPGLVVRIIGSDHAEKLFIVATYSDRQPTIYRWIDMEKGAVGLIRNSTPWIDPQRMQPQNIIKFKTRDGGQLDAYLTLPAGASKTSPAPLIVLPHGGPWARDNWGFDGESQFFASRGYAVLKPNYRGSTGYNWMFSEQDEYDFRKMHDDVTDATKAVISTGLVDSGRIAIMGGSFGGYLAISGVVNEPTLYRCAITNVGVFDWEELIKSSKSDRNVSSRYDFMIRHLGDPKKEAEKFAAISPGRQVEKIRVPVFVAGGKEDSNVEIAQSQRLVDELSKYKIPYEKFIITGEGHGMRHLQNQAELYTRIEAFLEKYLRPAQVAVAVAP